MQQSDVSEETRLVEHISSDPNLIKCDDGKPTQSVRYTTALSSGVVRTAVTSLVRHEELGRGDPLDNHVGLAASYCKDAWQKKQVMFTEQTDPNPENPNPDEPQFRQTSTRTDLYSTRRTKDSPTFKNVCKRLEEPENTV